MRVRVSLWAPNSKGILKMKDDNYIPKDKLEVGVEYRCDARNFTIGTWNGEAFDYIRHKFGDTFPDTEFHWDDGPPHGTVKPIEKV